MGLVADGGPTATHTFTGWRLKDSGSGNQSNLITGLAVQPGNFQVGPNFLWQKPMVGPIPGDVAGPRASAQRARRSVCGAREPRDGGRREIMIAYDPTPATWMWAWDNDMREDAHLAACLGFVFRHMPTTQDATHLHGRRRTATPRSPVRHRRATCGRSGCASCPARTRRCTWWRTRTEARRANGTITPQRIAHPPDLSLRCGGAARAGARTRSTVAARFNDWGPYDYHRDFNLTFPVQLMGDVSRTLGLPRWFDTCPQTRIGVRGTWRSLDENSPRYLPSPTDPAQDGTEWEVRTYLHFAM